MKRFPTLLTATVATLLVGCGSTVSSADHLDASTTPPDSLEAARQLWQHKGVESYSVTAQMTCYCPQDLVQPIRLEVAGGTVVASEGLKRPLKNLTPEGAQRLTVTGLFEFIAEARRREAQKLDVVYDAEYGFPARIDYDGHTMIADDERQYQLTNFQAR